ncbi:MAG: hypothetical protein IJR35_10680 [Synergistaceae bacterium]|nr:hypothetical protein [Synergistaceae bacterium]
MIKQELLDEVKKLIAAPMCNPELKAKAEAYLKAQDKASADELIKALEANVSSIEETLGFAESDMGKKVFGEQKAAEMAELCKKRKAEGEKFCICPACQAGAKIYAGKENLA